MALFCYHLDPMTDVARSPLSFGHAALPGESIRTAGASRRQDRPHRHRIWTGGLLLALMIVAGIGIDFARFARQVSNFGEPGDVRAEGIVALTGGTARIDGALALLADNRADRLLISGVNPAVGRRDIATTVEASYRTSLDQRVELGHLARDTIGNADEARAWVERRGLHSLIVVTSDYHMPRSMAELQAAMPEVELIPYPVKNRQLDMDRWWRHPNSVKLLLGEYVKYTVARARLALQPARGAGGEESTAAVTATTKGILR
jgi:uncharacterized SAM-binding protein YcdF (DUF218 family)